MRRILFCLGLAAAVGACSSLNRTTPYVVFFTADSAQIDEAANKVIQDASVAAGRAAGTAVVVAGYADPAGGVAYNRALSEARAQNVAEALRAAGVAPSRISVRPRGPVAAQGLANESRRVEIRIGI